jgi:chromate transporter
VTAAATGAIAGAVIVLARRALVDVPTWGMFAAGLGLVAFKKVPEPLLILAAGIGGVILGGSAAR